MKRPPKLYYRGLINLTGALLLATPFAACPNTNYAPRTRSVEQSPSPPLEIFNSPSTLAIRKICFTRGEFMFLRELPSGKETKLLRGQSPRISPDGTKVLFMAGQFDVTKDPWGDSIRTKLLDLTVMKVRELTLPAELHAYNAIWSYDGNRIAFETAHSGPGTAFGVFKPATSEWKILTRSTDLASSQEEGPFGLSSWAPGDSSLLIHSLESLYEVSLDGKVILKTAISELGIDSETRFSFSADRRYLLFDSTIDTKEHLVNDAVQMLDESTKQLITITPDTIEARRPMWVPTQKAIIFECMKRFDRSHQSGICAIGIDGKGLSVLVDDARQVSYAFQ